MAPLLGMAVLISGCGDKQSASAPQAGEQYGRSEPTPDAAIEAVPESNGTVDMTHRGTPMPALELDGPNKSRVRLADFKGKPLLINLWATWCGPCVAEMPTLDALAARTKAKLQVIVVSEDDKGWETVDPWWAKRDFKLLKPYLDPGFKLESTLNSGQLPTTVLYDGQGKEVWRVIGSMNWDGPRANTLLAEVTG
jgi:thiol-disulfide isomerase/thioredoxin